MPCIGHVKQICGGSWRASVYKINHNGQNVSTTYHTPTSQKQITSDKGIGVGIAVVLLLIIVAVISCLFWKRRKQKIHIKDSSMMDHVYDRNQNITTSDSSSIELHVYENGHPYGNSNSKITTRISNGCIEPQTCNTTMDNKPKTDYGHAHMKLDKRSIMKNILPSLFHNYFKLGNEKTDQEAGNQIADVSQTELDLTAGGSNGAYATLDSTETGFSKGKRVFLIIKKIHFIEMYNYIGCFRDRRIRRLLHFGPFTTETNEMSLTYASTTAIKRTMDISQQRTNLGSNQNQKINESACNMNCNGHLSVKCGGIWAASVYKINRNGSHGQLSTTEQTPTIPKQNQSDITDIGPMLSTTEHTPTSQDEGQSDIGIGIGLTILVFLSIVAAVSFLFWRRRKQRAHIKESSMSEHEYDRNQNVPISDSSSIELHIYDKCHTYGNANSNNTTRISNGYIEPQTCNTTANHVHSKPVTDPVHAQDKLDKRSIIKNMLPSLQHNYFKLVNDITGKVKRDHIADTSQTELHLTASGSNGAYAILDSTATGFSKGKRILPGNEQTNYQIKLEKKNHLIKGDEDYCCVEGEYNTLNKIRRFSNEGSLYSHAVDGVYDISGNNNQSKTTDHTYDHAIGSQTVIATDYDHVF
ncbi:unnamed protein product [Mytilus edulis]|uniref:Uncharacterized protein n=1 Tax=Mytilus edulis TaxID=6550 RepID=A0A8S3UJ30_MYTED|nr:unnamed protein product [Mytilus edulis]